MQTNTAYIALGSNLGDRAHNIQSAITHLRATNEIAVIQVATPLENPAIGGPVDSPPFLNTAAEIHTTLPPHALLQRLLEIELTLGRQRQKKWEPRVIDLDILLYGDTVLNSNDLTIPHPLMQERRFVLQPLNEIAPTAIHPLLHQTIATLLTKHLTNPNR